MGQLHLILGEVGSGKTVELDRRIAAAVNAGIRTFLIVPEQSTVAAERRMAESLASSAPLLFEATNFTRLADTFFRSEGGLAVRYADRTARTLAMWRALRELSKGLPEPASFDPASLERYLSAVRELTASRIDAGQIEEAVGLLDAAKGEGENAEEDGDVRLSDRLRALSEICLKYREILDERYADTENVLSVLAEKMKTSDFFSGTCFFFDSFTGFTEQQYAVIAELMRTSDLTVTLPLPKDPGASLCYEEPIKTLARLCDMARAAGVRVAEPLQLGRNRRTESAAIRHLTSYLFASDLDAHTVNDGEADGSVKIVEADDPYEAARYVSADVLKKIAEDGALYRDFAVLAGDPELYRGVLDVSFARNGIPYFFSQRTDLSALEPLKLVTSAYRAVIGYYRRNDVISVLKCGFSGLSEREADLFELYAETWSLSGGDFAGDNPWTMNPGGYLSENADQTYARDLLAEINAAKAKILPPLHKLAAASGTRTVPEHCRAIYDFLLSLDLPEQLKTRAEWAVKDKDPERAELYLRFWGVALTALDTLAEMLSDVTVTTEEFSALFDLVCRTSDVGRIPSSMDEVTVGSADLLRAGGVRYVYLFGANEGEFPGTVQGSGYFSESDRERLAECGIELGGTKKLRASRELFGFLRAVSAPTVSVTVLTNGLGADLAAQRTPSHAVERMKTLIPKMIETVKVSEMHPIELIRSEKEALSGIGRLVRDPLFTPLEKVLSRDAEGQAILRAAQIPVSNFNCAVSPELAEELFPNRMTLSHSRLKAFRNCPFSFFCDKVLHLKENEQAKIEANDVGTYFHAMLEAFFDPSAPGGWKSGRSDAEISAFTANFTKDYLKKIGVEQTPQTAYLFDELKLSADRLIGYLQDEVENSDFKPFDTELRLKSDALTKVTGNAPTALCVEIPSDGEGEGGALFIDGIVDRIDAARIGDDVYLCVTDYKTGSDVLRPGEIDKGESPQLLLYLFALLKNRNPAFSERFGVDADRIHPAAVRYLHVAAEKGSVKHVPEGGEAEEAYEKSIKHSGVYLNDPAVLAALDHTPEHRFLTELKGLRKDAFLTEEQFDEMLRKIEENLRADVKNMRSGLFRATPGSEGCKYCRMSPICRKYAGKDPESDAESDD